jgi:hypothetical protein
VERSECETTFSAFRQHAQAREGAHEAVQRVRVRAERGSEIVGASCAVGQVIGEADLGGDVQDLRDERRSPHLDQLCVCWKSGWRRHIGVSHGPRSPLRSAARKPRKRREPENNRCSKHLLSTTKIVANRICC